MQLKVVNKSAFETPKYETTQAAGMDLRANITSDVSLQPLERRLIPTGIYIELPAGFEGQVRPRSGLALKKGLSIVNTPGTIDADYRGEIGVILINLSTEKQTITPGERIAQLVISAVEHAEIVEAEELGETERGDGGFGHTGTN